MRLNPIEVNAIAELALFYNLILHLIVLRIGAVP